MEPLVTPGRNVSSALALIFDTRLKCHGHQEESACKVNEASLGRYVVGKSAGMQRLWERRPAHCSGLQHQVPRQYSHCRKLS